MMAGMAAAVNFDPEVVVGDRSVLLKWMPDADDPVFTGNLDLYPLGEQRIATEGAVPFFGFSAEGPWIWFWDEANRWFVGLTTQGDSLAAADTTGRLEEGLEPLCFAVHPMGSMLLAGLADGRIAAWVPGDEPDEAVLYSGHDGAVRALAFQPLASPQVFSFFSTGHDSTWKSWTQPGLLDKEAAVPTTGSPLRIMAVARNSQRVAVADEAGMVYLYSVNQLAAPRVTINEHAGAVVTALTYSDDGRRVAVGDASGRVSLWGTDAGNRLGGDLVEADNQLLLAFTSKESPYISFVTGAAVYGVIDGTTGRQYQVLAQLQSASVRWMALPPAGGQAYFSDAEGWLQWWNLGRCSPSADRPSCFGGYRLLRGLYPQDQGAPEELILERVYDFSDSTWGWTSADTVRWFCDPDSIITAGGDSSRVAAGPHNGVPYYYSLQKFYWTFLDGGRFRDPYNTTYEGLYRAEIGGEPTPLVARPDPVTTLPLLDDVYVVPNPYVEEDESSHFGPLSSPMVRFCGLPAEATVRIYTSSLDLVRTLQHRQDAQSLAGGALNWNLKNDFGREVVAGLYLYAVETPSGETTRGFLTIVR
jgi:WD40 repeat protein